MKPRAFLSYSWTSAKHQAWVIDLATELVQSGVDVVLDKWDLREGQDKYHFMETMVKDPTITKVIVVADCEYARKADSRSGGVGTESQVISREIYESIDQRKFVAIVKEYATDGRPCLPTFLQSRIYIEMSDDLTRRDNFEQLVRWLFDKPQFEKPKLGRPPEYISSATVVSLGTSSRARHAVATIRAGGSNAPGATRDYLDIFATTLVGHSAGVTTGALPGDGVIEALPGLLPIRDEFVDVAFTVARYCDDGAAYLPFADFFELLLSDSAFSGSPPPNDERAATLRFVVYEFVVYYWAALIKHGRLSQARMFLERQYLLPPSAHRPGGLRDFEVFQQTPTTLAQRSQRLQRRLNYAIADLIKERATRSDLQLLDLAQADFVAFVFSLAHHKELWEPYAALVTPEYEPLPLFHRATSARVFSQLADFLGVASAQELRQVLRTRLNPQWISHWEGLEISMLLNDNALATRP